MKNLAKLIKSQLPAPKLHQLGTVLIVANVGLLLYFQHAGNAKAVDALLAILAGLLLPAPFRSQNEEETPE